MHLMEKLWNIWHFLPFSIYFSFILSFLTTWMIYSLLVHGFFTCDACQSWMNFKTIFWLILVEYIMHLCLSLLMIQLLFSSWVYSLLVSKLYNQKNLPETLKPSLLYWVFWDCVVLFLHSLGNNFWHKQ